MYLIHVRFQAPADKVLPHDVARSFSHPPGGDGAIEHVTSHPDAPAGPTVGLFITAADLSSAEKIAAQASQQAVTTHPGRRGFTIAHSAAALIPGPWWNIG
ncbi:hypothetical protein ACWELO_33695 [Streptomyces sp. NPDC004596]